MEANNLERWTNPKNVADVAAQLGVCRSRVRQLAHSRHLGTKLGHIWIFIQKDIDAMRDRKPGKPPLKTTKN